MTKRYRVYFEEHARVEIIVHAETSDEALARCRADFKTTENARQTDFKLRCDTSEWKVETLGAVTKD